MPRFKITSTYVIDAETDSRGDRTSGDNSRSMIVTEMTIARSGRSGETRAAQTMAQKVVATTTALVKDAAVQAGIAEKTPICPDHQVAMQKRPSKFGQGKFYWSCPAETRRR